MTDMNESLEELRHRALELVRGQYELVANVAGTDSEGLAAINRVRPPALRYHSINELVREWATAAGQVASFAGSLGLITADQARQIILDFQAAHPELRPEE